MGLTRQLIAPTRQGMHLLTRLTTAEAPAVSTLPVTCLHHGTGSVNQWRYIEDLLTCGVHQEGALAPLATTLFGGKAPRYQVVSYDRPGHGGSTPRLRTWRPDYHTNGADDLIHVLDAHSIDQTALIGHSDGATISLIAAARFPDRVSCVISLAPHMWFDLSLIQGFSDFSDSTGKDPRFHAAVERDHGANASDVVPRWLQWWSGPTAHSDWDVRHYLSQVTQPVLTVHGASDVFFPKAHARACHDDLATPEWNKEFVVVSAGHSLDIERGPQSAVYGFIASFLAQHWPVSTSAGVEH